MAKTISALITTTGENNQYLKKLMDSLYQQTVQIKKIIIVYDDKLKEGEKIFKDTSLPVTLIDNSKKQSLTYLCNKAICDINEDYIICLNDDIFLKNNFIFELMLIAEKYNKIGIVCGKILRMDKKTIDSAGQFLAKNRKPLDRGYGQKDQGQYDSQEFVFGACGAAVLYRKKMLDDIAITPSEYFDNDYNMFYEDLDISWRANNFGWRAFYNSKAVAYHNRGTTAKSKKPKFKFLQAYNFAWLDRRLKIDLIKNRYMTIIKNEKIGSFLSNLPHIFLYELKLWSYCLIFEPLVVLDFINNIITISKAFRKRKLIAKKKKRVGISKSYKKFINKY